MNAGRRSSSFFGLVAVAALVLLEARAASAQAPAACYPACRDGYVCHNGQCVSACNPPCPGDQVCIAGRRCDYALPPPPPPPPGAMVVEPPLPPRKGFEQRGFFMLGFHMGLSGGDVEQDSTSYPLDSTFGFNLRGDVPIERYFVVGPLIQFGAWRPDLSPAPNRNYYVDADLYLRGRLPFTGDTTNFQIWAGMPVGLTVDILGQDLAGVSNVGLGWNIGFLVGGAVHFSPNFGLFSEVGWMQHKFTHSAEPNVYLGLAQWVFNVGFVFRE